MLFYALNGCVFQIIYSSKCLCLSVALLFSLITLDTLLYKSLHLNDVYVPLMTCIYVIIKAFYLLIIVKFFTNPKERDTILLMSTD